MEISQQKNWISNALENQGENVNNHILLIQSEDKLQTSSNRNLQDKELITIKLNESKDSRDNAPIKPNHITIKRSSKRSENLCLKEKDVHPLQGKTSNNIAEEDHSCYSNNALSKLSSKQKLNNSTLNQKICRICYEQETEINKLIQPCLCSGTSQFIHSQCLKKWIDNNSKKTKATDLHKCEVCSYTFQLRFEFGYKFSKDKWIDTLKQVLMEIILTGWVLFFVFGLMFLIIGIIVRMGRETQKIVLISCVCFGVLVIAAIVTFKQRNCRNNFFIRNWTGWTIWNSFEYTKQGEIRETKGETWNKKEKEHLRWWDELMKDHPFIRSKDQIVLL